jgi:hypothetical protein
MVALRANPKRRIGRTVWSFLLAYSSQEVRVWLRFSLRFEELMLSF